MRLRTPFRVSIILVGMASFGGSAPAQTPSSILPAQPVLVSPAPVADKPLALAAGGCPCSPDDGGTRFGVDLLFGQFDGIRGQMVVSHGADGALVVEAFYGAILSRLSSGEAVGGGGRYYIRRTDRSGDNSLLIGPGLGAYYQTRDGAWMAAPTADFIWVRAIGDTAAWELGLNAGLGVGLSDGTRRFYERREAGQVTPLFSLFTGFRF